MHITLAAVCFLLRNDEILLMQHASGAMRGWLSVIGGKMEPGETPEETIRREVAEETGLLLTHCRHAGTVRLLELDDRTTVLDLFVATGFEGTLSGSEEGLPQWHAIAEVDQTALIGYLRLLWPLVLEPDSLVAGWMRIGGSGEVQSCSLQHRSGSVVRPS